MGTTAPGRMVYSSSRGGSWQGWAADATGGADRQVTRSRVGNRSVAISPDGETVVWFEDETGDEVGLWLAEAFQGGGTRELLAGAVPAVECGLAWGGAKALVGLADENGFRIHVVDSAGTEPARSIYDRPQEAMALALSLDDTLALISCAEIGDSIHPDLRVLRASDGKVVAEYPANGVLHLSSGGWSPNPSDPCLAVNHDESGHLRPQLWWPLSGRRRSLPLALRGELEAVSWYPNGNGILLRQLLRGRHRMFRMDLESGQLAPLLTPRGAVAEAEVRPDGEVWALCSSARRPPRVLQLGSGREVGKPLDRSAPLGHAFQNWTFRSERGWLVHGFLSKPPGPGPHPTVIWVHGGPHWLVEDSYPVGAGVSALVDQGFLVAAPNYRGSIGYGSAHQDQLNGNPGLPEVADVAAGLADLVARGLADPSRVALMGASWGGYITLLGLGLRPELFAAGVARVPVADYPLAFAEESEPLKAMDRALFGGTPEEVPQLYQERSPLTYAARLAAPVLVQAGEYDSRCPFHQIEVYVRRLEELGKVVTFSHYGAGHSALVVDQEVALTGEAIKFLRPLLRQDRSG